MKHCSRLFSTALLAGGLFPLAAMAQPASGGEPVPAPVAPIVAVPQPAAVQAAADTAPASALLSFEAAHQRMQQVSDQLAASRAAVEGARLQTQALQSLGGPIVNLSAGVTRYRIAGDMDLTDEKRLALQEAQQLGGGLQLPGPLGGLGTQIPRLLPDSLPYDAKGTQRSQAVSAVWPVYSGGLFRAVKQFSAAQEAEARADAASAAHQLDSTLVQRYFGAQLARRAAHLRQVAANTIAEHDYAAGRMLHYGMIARVERLQASAALEDARRQALKAQGDARLAQVALQRLLQREQPVQPASPLFVWSKPIEPLEHFQQLAQQHHPGLDKVAAKKQQAEQLHAAHSASWKPTVALYGRRELGGHQNWVAGVQASWTLRSAVDRRSMQESSAQKVLQAERTDAQARSDIALLVEKNWRAVEDARQQYLALAPGVKLAQEMMRLRSAGLREGTSTMTDLIDAHTNYTKIETERAQAANAYVQALAQLLESAGVPEQFSSYMRRADVRIAP